MNRKKTFEQFQRDYFGALPRVGRRLDTECRLHLPERAVLKMAWAADHDGLTFRPDEDGQAASIVFARLTNEVVAFVGALRAGALVAAWHHVRALIELRALVFHLWLEVPTAKAERVHLYLTWAQAAGWLRLQGARNAGESAIVAVWEKAEREAGPQWTDEDIDGWSKLFRVDVRKHPDSANWRPRGTSLTDLVKACDRTGFAMRDYWLASQAIHPSPLGGRLAGRSLLPIGWDWGSPGVGLAIDALMLHFYVTAYSFDRAVATDLHQRMRPEYADLLRAAGHPIDQLDAELARAFAAASQ